jgi:hypothetical protein
MKFILSLFIIILNLSVASAEIMDVGNNAISPIDDYVDFDSRDVTENELEALRLEVQQYKESDVSKDQQSKRSENKNQPKKGTAEYKARMKCLMSQKSVQECDKEFKIKRG